MFGALGIGFGRFWLPPVFGGGGVTPFSLSQLGSALKLDINPALITPSAGVVPSFTDATGNYAFTATTSPAYTASYAPAGGKPVLTFDGASAGNLMSASGTLPSTCWIFAVVERRSQNNVSTTDTRTIFEYPRAGDNLRHHFGTTRSTTDAAQTLLRRNGAGGTPASAANTSFGIDGTMHVIEVQNEALGASSLSNDGNDLGTRLTTTGATTLPSINLGGSSISTVDRQGMVLARLIAVDYSLIPGGRRNLYVKKLIGAFLQWLYGLQAVLPAGSPWKSAVPVALDYKSFSLVVQTNGNSIANYTNPFLTAALSYGGSTSASQNSFGNKGVAVARSDVGGTTFTECRRRETAGENTGTGTNDGTPLAEQNIGVVLGGEHYTNNVDSPDADPAVNWATMASLTDAHMTFVANAQGLSIAASRHGIWGPWYTWGDASAIGGSSRPFIAAEIARLKSTYAANLIVTLGGQTIGSLAIPAGLTMTEFACLLSAPGSPYADAAQYARGAPPNVLNREYDGSTGRGVHPNDTLCDLMVQYVEKPWLQSKGWVV